MSKIKGKKEIVASEPEVSANINMNLTHNDIIDVAIYSQLEILEPREEALKKEIQEVKNEINHLAEEFTLKKIEKSRASSSDTKTFYKSLDLLSKAYGKKADVIITDSCREYLTDEMITGPVFTCCNYAEVENYKQPVIMYRKGLVKKRDEKRILTGVKFKIKAKIGDIKIGTLDYCHVLFSNKEREDYRKKMQSLLDRYADLMNEYHKVYLEILELRYDDKKMKARIVKMSLSQSEKGQQILNLLEQASMTKVLE